MYSTPAAMEMALRTRARSAAKAIGVSTEDLLRRFHFQRYSRDIDLFRPAADDLTEAIESLRTAASRDLGDFFTFTEAAPVSHADETGGAKLKFTVLIGARKVGTVNIDIVVRRSPTGEPTAAAITPAVPIDWPDDWPQVQLYPLPDHLADKICAMYEWHANGTSASTRCRDLADILLIAQQETVSAHTVQTALHSERVRRLGIGTDLRLPSRFEIPDPTFWNKNYPPAAAEVNGLNGCRTLDHATAAADTFITPLLGSGDPGIWNPDTARWD